MGGGIVEECFCYEEETLMTVLKTSLFFAGDGFTVYDSKGEVVFRVQSYGPDSRFKEELILTDASGRCILTVRRKRPSLHHRWEGFLGERIEGQKPMFSVRHSSIIGRSSVTVELYGKDNSNNRPPVEEYQIEGSFSHRCCTFYDSSRNSVAEIKRKVASCANIVLGKDVFCLCLKPGFDCAFAMGVILVLDQINDNNEADIIGDNSLSSPPS
ncbi:protein LURP-one-related 12-like [Tasmannia lanceolata]|uniref:protein LURP-one-related 12-like n=1 Tax=Tasmannia lanceolata TaxID=3420 RepID=UPI00406381EA